MGSLSVFRPYYYGEYKWDNYLLDIEQSVERGTQQSLDLADDAMEQLRQQNANLLHIRETLQNGLEEMRAEFQWGFTLMVDRMDHQIEFLSEIAERLDAIHRTLRSPLMTQARELFNLGQERFRKGLWDKALEAFLKAEEKNEVDFLLQLQTGKLLLYGRNEDNNVINLEEAEKHLVLAARFAQAERETLPEWSNYCGQAHFHVAIAEYLIGEDRQTQGQQRPRDDYLRKALDHLSRAVTLWPEFTESINLQAKCHCLLGERDETLKKLQILSDRDRRYYAKAKQDHDFHSLLPEIEIVFQRAVTQPGPLARATQRRLDEDFEALAWARRSNSPSTQDSTKLEEFDGRLRRAKQALGTVDVDIEALHAELGGIRNKLDDITNKSLTAQKNSIESDIRMAETRPDYCKSEIARLEGNMEGIGAGWGCLIAFVVFWGTIAGGSVVLYVIAPGHDPNLVSHDTGVQMGFGMLAAMLICGLSWAAAVRSSKNRPRRNQIIEMEREMQESRAQLPGLRAQLDKLGREIQRFSDWRAAKPTPPLPQSRRPSANSQVADCSVVLTFVGSNKIDVIKAVRETTDLGLKEAKELVDKAPQVVKEGISRNEAYVIKKIFDKAGARVQIKQG